MECVYANWYNAECLKGGCRWTECHSASFSKEKAYFANYVMTTRIKVPVPIS